MSDKSKLSYYFTRKSEIPSQQSCDMYDEAIVNTDIINTDIVNINESDRLNKNNETPYNSSIVCIIDDDNDDQNETCASSTIEYSLTTSTTNNYEPLVNLKADSYKRDPGRGPLTAKEFVLLGPYQPNINFPTHNHRHFCRTWYQFYP